MMGKNGSWTLPAILGISGIIILLDAFFIKILLPANKFFEGFLGVIFIILAIATHNRG